MEARPQRKARATDAIRKCENDPLVIISVARLFFIERNVDKARNWFEKAVKINPDLGDAWAWLLKFENVHGDEASRKSVIERCVAAEPRHGEFWQQVSKNLDHFGLGVEKVLGLVANLLEIRLD